MACQRCKKTKAPQGGSTICFCRWFFLLGRIWMVGCLLESTLSTQTWREMWLVIDLSKCYTVKVKIQFFLSGWRKFYGKDIG